MVSAVLVVMQIRIKKIEDREVYIVTTKKGLCYFINSAEPFLNEDEIKDLWKTSHKEFSPYYGQYGY